MVAEFTLRKACAADFPALYRLYRASMIARGCRYYNRAQLAGFFADVEGVPPGLLQDGTYYVLESGGEIVAGGGWTPRGTDPDDPEARRRTGLVATIHGLFTTTDRAGHVLAGMLLDRIEGDAARRGRACQIEIGATLAEVGLFQRRGYLVQDCVHLDLSNGVFFEVVRMKRRLMARSHNVSAPAAAEAAPFVLSRQHRRDAA